MFGARCEHGGQRRGSVGTMPHSIEAPEVVSASPHPSHMSDRPLRCGNGSLSTIPPALLLPVFTEEQTEAGGVRSEVPMRSRRAVGGVADRAARRVVEARDPGADRRAARRDRRRARSRSRPPTSRSRRASRSTCRSPRRAWRSCPPRLLGDTVKSLSDAPVDVETDGRRPGSGARPTRARSACSRPRTSRGCRSPAARRCRPTPARSPRPCRRSAARPAATRRGRC